jgi:uncharacterized pyridoxamine 5'-phosphate oxidase family protein
MNRLNIINFINPSWHKQISEFLEEHPIFNKLLPIVALDEYPNGFNKNPHETDEDAPRNIFETIIYGVAHAGVDIEYGKKEYLQIVNYLRKFDTLQENMDIPFKMQSKKKRTYKDLINTLVKNNISVDELLFSHMPIIEKVWGIGESTTTLLYLLYAETDNEKVIPFSDKQFNRGMEMFYKIEAPINKRKLKEHTDTWKNKKVGLMFIVQYAHYSEYV